MSKQKIVGVSGGSSPQLMSDMALLGSNVGAAWSLGNFTAGTRFRVQDTKTLLGARIWARGAVSPLNVKMTLWRSDLPAAPLATKTTSVDMSDPGRQVELLFDAAVVLSPLATLNVNYVLGIRDTTGARYPMLSTAGGGGGGWNGTLVPNATFMILPGIALIGGAYVAGDAMPNSAGGGEFYPITPLFDL